MQKLEIEKNKEEYRGKKTSLKRRNKLCKKNQMKPHEYGELVPHIFLKKIIWHERFCIHCNKKHYEF